MTVELSKEAKKEAVASIEKYFEEKLDQRIGNIAAAELLGFFLEEIAPVVYNRAVAIVQERMQARVMELDIDVHEEPFGYWRKYDRRRGE